MNGQFKISKRLAMWKKHNIVVEVATNINGMGEGMVMAFGKSIESPGMGETYCLPENELEYIENLPNSL